MNPSELAESLTPGPALCLRAIYARRDMGFFKNFGHNPWIDSAQFLLPDLRRDFREDLDAIVTVQGSPILSSQVSGWLGVLQRKGLTQKRYVDAHVHQLSDLGMLVASYLK